LFTLRHGSLPTMTHCPFLRRLQLRSLAARRGREPPKRTISALHRNRSSGFRSSTIDSKRAHFVPHSKLLRTCRFPFGYGDQLLNLANDQDSLGHFSKRTYRRCSYHRFHAYTACTHLVSRSFHIPLRILFSFHSRYL